MSDVDHNSVYHRKMALLQEKLRKSEEERLKLEEKFSVMMKACKEEEEERLSHLKLQYENFLEEDRRRRDRNDKIMRSLDRIESRAATLNAKSKRLKLLREHYEAYLKRVYPTWKNKSTVTTSARNNHAGYSPISNFDQHIDSSYAECFTTPFTTNRRNSVSFSDNLTSPRLMDISHSPRNYGDIMSPSSFARYQQHTLDREVTGGKSKFPPNVYQKTVVKNGMEYDRGPDSYIGINVEFNNTGTFNNSQNIINGYSEFIRHSANTDPEILFNTDTQKYPSAYANRVKNLSDGKTEIQSPHGKLQSLHENNSSSVVDSGKDRLNPVCKRESKVFPAGVSADIEWEQNTSRDLLNLSLTDDGKVSNSPCKTEQLMKHQQNLQMLKMQMEDVKVQGTESSNGDHHNVNKDFLEGNIYNQGKEDLSSDYNKQEESGAAMLHKTYEQDGHTETDQLNGIKAVDNSADDISIEIGRKIEKALSSEREAIRPSDSPEKQRNLDIIVEETNSTEETHSQTKSLPEKSDDLSLNDTELLSGAILTEGDDELQYSLSNEAGLNESTHQQTIVEEKAVHETTSPTKGEQITTDLMPQGGDFAKEDFHANFEGNTGEANQSTYKSNIQNGDDSVMYLQQPQNAYETASAYLGNVRTTIYDDYNNETVNAQVGEQYLQEASKQEVPAETYDVQSANFASGLQQMQTGGDLNESGIIYDDNQDQNYTYNTVQNVQEGYNPEAETSENFYVETYDSSDPNFGQQLQPNSVVPDQNWAQYNEMTFQGDNGQNTVQSAYQDFEIQHNMDSQNLQPGEFIYSQEMAGNESQYYTDNLGQQGPYNQELCQDQYFYGNNVQPDDVHIQDDVSGHKLDYATNDGELAQQIYQQGDEGARSFSPQSNQEPNLALNKTDDGAAISHSKLPGENKVPDISLQQSSEHTENLHAVANESYERSGNNSEMQRQMLEKQNACSNESVPNTVQDSIPVTNYSETENGNTKEKFHQDPNSMETGLAHSETTKNKTDYGINIDQSPHTTGVQEVVASKESNDVQGDVRDLKLLDTITEEVKKETHHTDSSNSCKDFSSNDQYKDISRHQEVVESDSTTKSEEKILNNGNKKEQTDTSSKKEPSDLEPAKSVISGEEEYTESFDGGKYHEPTVAYESGILGYSNTADSSTTEDSSERWTTMPKKTRQQMTLKVQNKKAETTLPPDEDSSEESGQIQPVLYGSQFRATSEDSGQLGEQKEPLHTGGTTTSQTEIKLSRIPARGSSKLPIVSTVMDSDNDSLHLGSESSMT